MVSESFSPQIQALLFNYTEANASADNLEDCGCRGCFQFFSDTDLDPTGHICTPDTRSLRWPYLADLTAKGKKYRLPGDLGTVQKELDMALEGYMAWALKNNNDASREEKLVDWAKAVRGKAVTLWKEAQEKKGAKTIDGYPGLRQAILEAREKLVFLHDDRAPHGLFIVCKRSYQKCMAHYLADSAVFEELPTPWEEVMKGVKQFPKVKGFEFGEGLVYNYGIWKPKKQKYRFIAGTRSPEASGPDFKKPSGPPRGPTYHLCKALVSVLKVVIQSLKALYECQRQRTGLRCFWRIDSVDEFSRLVRVNGDLIAQHGMETYDFTIMYTAFELETMVDNAMLAILEAQDFEASKLPQAQGILSISSDGGTGVVEAGPWQRCVSCSPSRYLQHTP